MGRRWASDRLISEGKYIHNHQQTTKVIKSRIKGVYKLAMMVSTYPLHLGRRCTTGGGSLLIGSSSIRRPLVPWHCTNGPLGSPNQNDTLDCSRP